jgi:hypothetical protein
VGTTKDQGHTTLGFLLRIVAMKVSKRDFKYLWATSCQINGLLRTQAKDGRFASPEDHKPIEIDKKATNVYWFENYASIVLARHFLESNGHMCQIGLDEWTEEFGAIFTDYICE